MNKQFKCYWDAKFYASQTSVIKGINFFTEDNGYDIEEINKINDMNIGQMFIIDIGHEIERIK